MAADDRVASGNQPAAQSPARVAPHRRIGAGGRSHGHRRAVAAQSGEYSYEEIGAMLDTPTGTIKWRVSEARKAIKKGLRERGYGDVA
jgi:hypothetical protein